MITISYKSTLKCILGFSFSLCSLTNYSQAQASIKIGDFVITPIEIATIKTKLKTETISEPINIFLIQTKGNNILIDAGIDTSWNCFKRTNLKAKLFYKKFNIDKSIDIDTALAPLNLTKDSINYLLFTHLHFDHIFNANQFKNAKYILSKRELKAFHWGLMKGYLKIHKRLIKESTTIDFHSDISLKESYKRSFEVLPGLKLLPCYGHTKGHINVLISVDGKNVLFTGDSGFQKKEDRKLLILKFLQNNPARCLSNHSKIQD